MTKPSAMHQRTSFQQREEKFKEPPGRMRSIYFLIPQKAKLRLKSNKSQSESTQPLRGIGKANVLNLQGISTKGLLWAGHTYLPWRLIDQLNVIRKTPTPVSFFQQLINTLFIPFR